MSMQENRGETFIALRAAARLETQAALRERIQGPGYLEFIRDVCLENPFLKLTDEELAHFRSGEDHLDRLIAARDTASKTDTPKIAVFCMPKSGSSFVQTALRHALEIPHLSLTTVGSGGAGSHFGMNSREQELDEFAIVKSIHQSKRGFVTQAHTRCSVYLANQLTFYGIKPILTVRNILDCIVSFDDMMIAWRAEGRIWPWLSDTQFSLPLDYCELDHQTRYRILAASYGIWLIAFYLSWKRCMTVKAVQPLVLRYEADVLNPEQLVNKLSAYLALTKQQAARLARYVVAPDREKSRINVGIKGRGGQKIDPSIVAFLTSYAAPFRSELDDTDLSYLIG